MSYKIFKYATWSFIALILAYGLKVSFGQSYSTGLPLPGLPKSLGPKPMSGSTSVTLATNQTAIPISGSITSMNASVTTNYATAATQSNLIAYIDPQGRQHPFVGDATGITVSANQGTSPWVTSRNWTLSSGTDSVTVSGGVAITNTATVNQGTSPWVTSRTWNLNGLSDSVGVTGTVSATQGTTPWNTSVTGTITSQPVTATASTVTRATNSLSNQTLLNANGSRKSVFLYNDSTNTGCFVKFGATASATSFTIKLFSTDTYIMDPPVYTGIIDYICDTASGSMEVNEQ
jgi:hypothetical protein